MARRRRFGKDSFTGNIFGRLVRAVVAVAVLTAFVLAIAFGIKTLSSVNGKKIVGFVTPYLAKAGIEEDQIGEVAGTFFEMIGDLDMEGISSSRDSEDSPVTSETLVEELSPQGDVVVSIAIIADSHLANDAPEYIQNKTHLRRALAESANLGVEKIVHVGDVTNWGVLGDLQEAKTFFDETGADYIVLPGDRDLAQSVGIENFKSVFGQNYGTFEASGNKFVLLDNSANYSVIPSEIMTWFENEVKDADFVIVSQPLFTDGLVLFNYLYMGNSADVPTDPALAEKQTEVLAQRNKLLELIRQSPVKAVIAGDHHKSSQITDSERESLEHYVVGSTAETLGELSKNVLQSQRFSVLEIYENGAYNMEDVILEIFP